MPNDHYRVVSAQLPYKTCQVLEAMALEYGLSRANTIVRIIEKAVMEFGEPVEVSAVTPDGKRHKNNIPVALNNELRRLL